MFGVSRRERNGKLKRISFAPGLVDFEFSRKEMEEENIFFFKLALIVTDCK